MGLLVSPPIISLPGRSSARTLNPCPRESLTVLGKLFQCELWQRTSTSFSFNTSLPARNVNCDVKRPPGIVRKNRSIASGIVRECDRVVFFDDFPPCESRSHLERWWGGGRPRTPVGDTCTVEYSLSYREERPNSSSLWSDETE